MFRLTGQAGTAMCACVRNLEPLDRPEREREQNRTDRHRTGRTHTAPACWPEPDHTHRTDHPKQDPDQNRPHKPQAGTDLVLKSEHLGPLDRGAAAEHEDVSDKTRLLALWCANRINDHPPHHRCCHDNQRRNRRPRRTAIHTHSHLQPSLRQGFQSRRTSRLR